MLCLSIRSSSWSSESSGWESFWGCSHAAESSSTLTNLTTEPPVWWFSAGKGTSAFSSNGSPKSFSSVWEECSDRTGVDSFRYSYLTLATSTSSGYCTYRVSQIGKSEESSRVNWSPLDPCWFSIDTRDLKKSPIRHILLRFATHTRLLHCVQVGTGVFLKRTRTGRGSYGLLYGSVVIEQLIMNRYPTVDICSLLPTDCRSTWQFLGAMEAGNLWSWPFSAGTKWMVLL
jgi:hypothetical protein